MQIEELMAAAAKAGMAKFYLKAETAPRDDMFVVGADFVERLHAELAARQPLADSFVAKPNADCSGDPTCCPDNEGYGCACSQAQPVAGELPPLPFHIEPKSLAALRRFYECALDSEGYDVPASTMKVLAAIGLLNHRSAGHYETSEFGLAVLNNEFAAQPVQQPAAVVAQERWANAINALLSVATAAYYAMDNSEERANASGGEDAEYIVQGSDFTELSAAMDEIDALPDDRPGYTLSGGARAHWALRDLFTTTVPAAGVQGDASLRQKLEDYFAGHEQAIKVVHALMDARDKWKAKAEGKDSGRDAALSHDAKECLMDVVSHHGDFHKACNTTRDLHLRENNRDSASYWDKQTHVLARMKVQAERALAAHPAPSSDAAIKDALQNAILDLGPPHKDERFKDGFDSCRYAASEVVGNFKFPAAAHPANGDVDPAHLQDPRIAEMEPDACLDCHGSGEQHGGFSCEECGGSGKRPANGAQADHDEAVRLLGAIFDAWENGEDCYEDGNPDNTYMGKCFRLDDEIFQEACKLLNRLNPPRNVGAQTGLSDEHRAVIAEAAQVLESAAAHNRSKWRTVLAHTQQERADRLREVFLAAAPQKKEG